MVWKKTAKILTAVLAAVFSIIVLAVKVPEMECVQNTIEQLDESKNTVMEFSGATIAISLAMSALPDDFASPLAETLTSFNTYFVFFFAVLFLEKLIVVEGIKIAFIYIIPCACFLYIIWILSEKDIFKNFAGKILTLGMAIVLVIPVSTHFTEKVGEDYLAYVDETIAETGAGADKINNIMIDGEEDATLFDKLSEAFKTAVQSVSDLLTYFKNVIKKCVNSIAIMLVTTFVLPMLILLLFRWLLNELFSLHLPSPSIKISMQQEKTDLVLKKDGKCDDTNNQE